MDKTVQTKYTPLIITKRMGGGVQNSVFMDMEQVCRLLGYMAVVFEEEL